MDPDGFSWSGRPSSFIMQLAQNHGQTSPIIVNNFKDNILVNRSQLLSSILLMTLLINDVHEQLLYRAKPERVHSSKHRTAEKLRKMISFHQCLDALCSTVSSHQIWRVKPRLSDLSRDPSGLECLDTGPNQTQMVIRDPGQMDPLHSKSLYSGTQQKPAGNNTENPIH